MKQSLVLFLTVLMYFWVQPLSAQNPFSVELRTGASFATQDLGDADLSAGFGFEGIVDYRFMPQLSAFAGWGWNRFTADESFLGTDVKFEETGYLLGLQFTQPIGDGPLALYARAGGIYNHIEVENDAGDITQDSGHGFGFRVGAGLDIDLGSNWLLKPGVRYQALSRELDSEGGPVDVDLTYVAVSVGIAKRF